MTVAVLSRLRR